MLPSQRAVRLTRAQTDRVNVLICDDKGVAKEWAKGAIASTRTVFFL